MVTERLAVAAVFLCIGILLLSACGLPLAPPARPRPQTVFTNFALYTPDHHLVATGVLDGTTDLQHIRAELHFADCLASRPIDLLGALNPTLVLHSDSATGPRSP